MEDINERLRPISSELKTVIEVLKVKYPPPNIRPQDTIADIMYQAGAYNVILHLQSLLKNFEETDNVH